METDTPPKGAPTTVEPESVLPERGLVSLNDTQTSPAPMLLPTPPPIPQSRLEQALALLKFVQPSLATLLQVSFVALFVGLLVPGRVHNWAARILVVMHSNWRALILLAVVLFYQDIRSLLSRLTKLPGGAELEPHPMRQKRENPEVPK